MGQIYQNSHHSHINSFILEIPVKVLVLIFTLNLHEKKIIRRCFIDVTHVNVNTLLLFLDITYFNILYLLHSVLRGKACSNV